MPLDIWIVGDGAREQAIYSACLNSPLSHDVSMKSVDDCYQAISLYEAVDLPELVIFGPEEPVCLGLVDKFAQVGVKCIGVDKKFSRLESSKLFAKQFMANNGIKCAKLLPIESDAFPQVLKFDGLCKGKGVKVVYSDDEKNEFARKFLGMRYFIEEFLEGDEISVMSYFYGGRLINFRPARDFKRLSADKNSPNTGGMGAYCPVNLTKEQQKRLDIYLNKLETALIKEGAEFQGFIYSGLIWTRDDWYVLEYNVRLGDPECQAILENLENDFLDILLNGSIPRYKKGVGACLTIAAEGYPDTPVKNDEIILPKASNVTVYKAGVREENGKMFSNGGRVLSLCINSDNPFPQLREYADRVVMKHKYFRKDIDIIW